MRRLAFVALGLVGLLGCGHAKGDSEEEKATPQATVAAKTSTARGGEFTEVVTAMGRVVPRPGHFAELGAPQETRVVRIYVATGDRVEKGAPLVQFDPAPFEAEARSAEARLKAARHAWDRASRLVEAGVAPGKDLDQAEADLAEATAAAAAARRNQDLA